MQILNAALQQAHSKNAESTASPQLRQAANEFEASFLQELLKPMTEDSMFNSGSGGGGGGSMGTVGSIAAQALADGIAKDGGLGIAKRVLAELTPIESAKSKGSSIAGTQCGGCAPHLQSLATDPAGNLDAEAPRQPRFIWSGESIGDPGILPQESH